MPIGRPKVPRVKVTCMVCDKEVERYLSQVQQNKSGRFFCSDTCRNKLGPRPQTIAPKACEVCGKEFMPYGKKARERGHLRFCSRACQRAWQARNRVQKFCEVCGKEFWLAPSQAEYVESGRFARKARFCSRACMGVGAMQRPLERRHNGKPAVLDLAGYVRIYEPDHPNAYKGGWVTEHRLVAEQTLGRTLKSDEHVHHINGKKDDNRPENLAVIGHGEHSTITGLENGRRMREWEEYRRRYGPLDG